MVLKKRLAKDEDMEKKIATESSRFPSSTGDLGHLTAEEIKSMADSMIESWYDLVPEDMNATLYLDLVRGIRVDGSERVDDGSRR